MTQATGRSITSKISERAAGAAALVAAVLLAAPAARAQQPASFDELEQYVIEAENGTRMGIQAACCSRPDGAAAPCTEEKELPFQPDTMIGLACQATQFSPSGYDIAEACYVLFDTGALTAGFLQNGLVGDVDADGDPNADSVPIDVLDGPGIDNDLGENYSLELLMPGVIASIDVTDVNVQDFSLPEVGAASGLLCLVDEGGGLSAPRFGPQDSGCFNNSLPLIGNYRAGSSGTTNPGREVLLQIDDLAEVLAQADDRLEGLPNGVRFRSDADLDQCGEDLAAFTFARREISLDKDVSGVCRDERFEFTATYTLTNTGSVAFDDTELEDSVVSNATLSDASCTADGAPLPECADASPGEPCVELGANGSFRAINLGSLPAPDPGQMSGDPKFVRCTWTAPVTGFQDGEEAMFDNEAVATGIVGAAMDTAAASAGVDVLFEEAACRPPVVTGMRKEHEGVGFDNALSLTPTLNAGSFQAFGSNVEPGGTADVARAEGFTAQGAIEFINRPGVFQTLPRIPPKAGVKGTKGVEATFTYRMLVTGDALDTPNFDVTCAVCARKQEPEPRGSETQTETAVPPPGNGVLNEPLQLRVFHECGPIHPAGACGGPMRAAVLPGLFRESTAFTPENYVTFMGCKPTTIQLDPLSSGDLLLPGDIIQVELFVPSSERARIVMDATSCEAAYLTMTPKGP